MKSSMLFINPKAGMLKGCLTPQEVKAKLRGLKLDPEISIGKTSRGIHTFIRAVKSKHPDVVLIAAGDGTTATILKGLRNESTTFGLIPTGSLNNIGQSIGLSGDLDQAVEVINAAKVTTMDLAMVGREVFIESVGIGLLAQIMDSVGEQDTKKEVLKVAAHTIRTVVAYDDIPVTITTPDKQFSTQTMWLTITNTGRAAATLVDPSSKVNDHLLELVYCEPLKPTELTRYTMAFLRNTHLGEAKFHRLRAREFKLTLSKPTAIHVDGRVKKATRMTVRVVPSAVKVFAP